MLSLAPCRQLVLPDIRRCMQDILALYPCLLAKPDKAKQLPSVPMVIPVHRSDRQTTSITKRPPPRTQRRRQDANDNCDVENDLAAHGLIGDHSTSISRPNDETKECLRKKRSRTPSAKVTIRSTSALTDDAT